MSFSSAFLDSHICAEVAALLAAGEHVLLVGHRGSGKSLVSAAALTLLANRPDTATYTRIGPVSTVPRRTLLNDLATLERAVVVIDRASLVDHETLQLLRQAVVEREALLLIEADSRRALPPTLGDMLRRSRHSTVAIAPLEQNEFHERLVEQLGGPVPAEITGYLWRSCGGNRELLGVLVDALIEREELLRGEYAWTCRVPICAEMAEVPHPAVLHVERQFHALNSEQQHYLRLLSLCGSISTATTPQHISDDRLEALENGGFVCRSLRRDSAEVVQLRAPILGWIINHWVLPGARAEIFASLPTPRRDREDPAAVLAWTQLALQVGARPSAEQIALGGEAAFSLLLWGHVEQFVDAVIPANLLEHELVEHLLSLASNERQWQSRLLLQRGLSYYFQDRQDRTRADARVVGQVIAFDPAAARSNINHLFQIEVNTYRLEPDDGALEAVFERALGHAAAIGEELLVEAYRIRGLTERSTEVSQRTPLATLEQTLAERLGTFPFAVFIVPQTALRVALAGRFVAAFALIERTFGLRELRITDLPAHAHTFSFAELVTKGAHAHLLIGDADSALALLQQGTAQIIVDPAAAEMIIAGAHIARGHWILAQNTLRAVLQRLSEVDHNCMIKHAFAMYAQVSSALGDAPRATAAISNYEQASFGPSAIHESHMEYRVLVARLALGQADVPQRIDAYIERFTQADEWYAVVRAAHLALSLDTVETQTRYLETLTAAAAHVDDAIAEVFLRDAAATRASDVARLASTRAELARLGVWIPQQKTEVALSSRQREVASLIVGGLHNRDIAERLHLSVRTVESHVAMILAKFGISDRRLLVGRLAMLDPAAKLRPQDRPRPRVSASGTSG